MSNMFRVYQRLLGKYPVMTQAVQAGSKMQCSFYFASSYATFIDVLCAGTLMALGDQIAQNVIERRKLRELDFIRTAQFGSIGFFISGPATRTWYGILDRYIGSKGGIIVIKKVICDQMLFAPAFIAVLLTAIGTLQGNDFESLKAKLKSEYPDILRNNYKLWPMVQLANFYLIPLQYQALIVQSVALLWNTYISYRTKVKK